MTENEPDPKIVQHARDVGRAFAYLWKPLCWFLGASILIFEVVGGFLGHKVDPALIVLIGSLTGLTFVAPGPGGPP